MQNAPLPSFLQPPPRITGLQPTTTTTTRTLSTPNYQPPTKFTTKSRSPQAVKSLQGKNTSTRIPNGSSTIERPEKSTFERSFVLKPKLKSGFEDEEKQCKPDRGGSIQMHIRSKGQMQNPKQPKWVKVAKESSKFLLLKRIPPVLPKKNGSFPPLTLHPDSSILILHSITSAPHTCSSSLSLSLSISVRQTKKEAKHAKGQCKRPRATRMQMPNELKNK